MILDLECTPYDEKCAQVGQDDYYTQAKKEARVLIRQLKRIFGDNEEVSYRIKSNAHDFGTYYTIQINGPSDYVMRIDNEFPANWDEQARKELE